MSTFSDVKSWLAPWAVLVVKAKQDVTCTGMQYTPTRIFASTGCMHSPIPNVVERQVQVAPYVCCTGSHEDCLASSIAHVPCSAAHMFTQHTAVHRMPLLACQAIWHVPQCESSSQYSSTRMVAVCQQALQLNQYNALTPLLGMSHQPFKHY